MIRSSKLSLKFANKNKRFLLNKFIDEYRRVSQVVIDQFWKKESLPKYANIKKDFKVDTWLSATSLQALSRQVIGIIKGTKRSGKAFRKTLSKPTTDSINPQLDSRFVKISFDKKTKEFDGWIHIKCLGVKIILDIPFKKTKHFNKLFSKVGSVLRPGLLLSKKGISLAFEISPEERTQGTTLGIDIGISNIWTDSNGVCSRLNKHGYDLSKIMSILSRRKKGSKGFKRTQDHRTNYVNWSVKQIFTKDVSKIVLEDIKGLRKGKKNNGRFRSHWTYSKIFNRIEQISEEFGVQVLKVNPRNTSRKCSVCGVIDVKNRKGKVFMCVACCHTLDADHNAAINIASACTR